MRKPQGVAVFVLQQRQQVHATRGDAAERPVAGAAVVERELLVECRRGIDIPTAAGSIFVDIDEVRLAGFGQRCAEQIAAEVGDDDTHVGQRAHIGAHRAPGRARLCRERCQRRRARHRARRGNARREADSRSRARIDEHEL